VCVHLLEQGIQTDYYLASFFNNIMMLPNASVAIPVCLSFLEEHGTVYISLPRLFQVFIYIIIDLPAFDIIIKFAFFQVGVLLDKVFNLVTGKNGWCAFACTTGEV
jgi:hypothetical protein